MLNTFSLGAVAVSALLIAIADALIKRAAVPGNFMASVFNPWMIAICGLYLAQILIVVCIFIHKGDLAVYGNVFVVFYAVMMVVLGVLFFKENISAIQYLGIVLALTGAVLLNSGL